MKKASKEYVQQQIYQPVQQLPQTNLKIKKGDLKLLQQCKTLILLLNYFINYFVDYDQNIVDATAIANSTNHRGAGNKVQKYFHQKANSIATTPISASLNVQYTNAPLNSCKKCIAILSNLQPIISRKTLTTLSWMQIKIPLIINNS